MIAGSKDLELRVMESGGDLLLFVFNHGAEPAAAEIRLDAPAIDLIAGKPADLKKPLAPYEVRVLRVRR